LNITRRTFIVQSVVTGTALASTRYVQAQGALVVETEPQAVSLNYKADAAKVDKAKFPKFAAGQNCAQCILYQGKPGDAAGACPLFAGRQVAAKGWCMTWAKKA
jgi:High potential iron-sulfur protein